MSTYDVIVIGTGVAGGTVASIAKRRGLSTAIVDSRPYGGTCPQRGCDPKRVLTGVTEAFEDAKRLKGKGITGDFQLNWEDLKSFKDSFTEPVAKSVEDSFKEKGIQTYHGTASFLDPHTIEIGGEKITADKFVIATGARPTPLPIQGFNHMITSDDFFELEDIPDRVIFVGGGYISFEFAHLCARLGKEVVILHRGKHVLESFDNEITNKLIEHTKDLGVDIHTSTEVKEIEMLNSGGYSLRVKKFDHEHEIKGDLIIHGAGRSANVEKLNLETAGIEATKHGVKVNHNFQSVSLPHIYAAGDAADSGLKPLTPVAGEEAERLMQHLVDKKEQPLITSAIPSLVFTYPILGSVGITQQEAKAKRIPYEVQSRTVHSFFTYKRMNDEGAYVKLLMNPFTDELIGAHVLSSHADHLVNLFTAAIEKKMTKSDLRNMLWGYPTTESDIPSFF
ncbi:dihydrolipoyl dehydrogenase family protein [Halobacillus amylolyticus]|uniref:NAD(P)/FAD-dependent oxidoreductase n=1 Tax=Halobacillus amylolyticus TaxID=2932259 RepID=A0ABY4HDN8_9BACI|nr:NAD(P)/FAD-dependent oxidoreductase [Halobacillus amylolyticus]UOR13016.1 NAD(P)/FAD-dependent oxidoreductase [Halobacillus amylolyticus]